MKTLTVFIALALAGAVVLYAEPLSVFSIDNHYDGSLGTVVVSQTGGTTSYVDVSGPGIFNTEVNSGVIEVEIAGVRIPQGESADVTLPNGDRVRVTWSSPNVIVIDPLENN